MCTSAPTAADVETLLDTYAKLRRPKYLTPPQLLRSLQRDIDNAVLPCVSSLHRRSINAAYGLDEFVTRIVKSDKKAVDAALRGAKHAEKTAGSVVHEVEQIKRALKSLPPYSAKRELLIKALQVRLIDLELLSGRIERYGRQIEASQERIRQQVPSVADVQARVEAVQGKFTKAMLRLAFSEITSKLILGLPVVIAFFATLALDRAAGALDVVTLKVAPKHYHDIVLLVLFALQVLALTPATDAISAKLCWRSFDRAMNAVRSLLPELRFVETGVVEAEERITSLFSKSAQP